jgi:hypothetical protein
MTRSAADNVIRLLPSTIGRWTRGGDLSGAIYWAHDDELVPVVYATPNWEGEALTPLNVTNDFEFVEEVGETIPFDATQWIGREAEGASEYVRLLSPVLARVEQQYARMNP